MKFLFMGYLVREQLTVLISLAPSPPLPNPSFNRVLSFFILAECKLRWLELYVVTMVCSIVWFRRDLRLEDNPALVAAARGGGSVVPVYIWCPSEEAQFHPGRVSRWWLKMSLMHLDQSLRALGAPLLTIRATDTISTLLNLIHSTGATQLFYNRLYDPVSIVRDYKMKQQLVEKGFCVFNFNGDLLYESWQVYDENGHAYTRFNAFWETCLNMPFEPEAPLLPPRKLMPSAGIFSSCVIEELGLESETEKTSNALLARAWSPGWSHADKALDRFMAGPLLEYAKQRKKVDGLNTSFLSPYIHFGELSVRKVFHSVRRKQAVWSREGKTMAEESVNLFLRSIGLREYSRYLCFNFPSTHDRPLLRNLRFFHAYKSWRPKPSSTIFHISSSNTKIKTTPKNPSTAEQLKPFAQRSLESTPSANDAHDLNQGLSQSESKSVNPSKPTASVLTRQRPRHSKGHTWSPKIAALRAFARKLDLCEPTQEAVFEALDSFEETLNPKDAMVVMNNIHGWEKAYYFFQWLNKNEDFQMDSVTYNVTMKVLRRGKQWNRVEELLQNMLDQGLVPDNITYSTVISCAWLCNVPHEAVKWYEKVKKTGFVPDEVTCTAMIDAYSRAGKVQEALNLYERARADGWRPDMKAFVTLLNVYNVSGDFDGALKIFQEMKALGVKPNLVAYNIMFCILAKVGKPSVAKTLFKEMTGAGLYPNKVTLTSLLRAYSKSGWAVDCLKLWDKMKEEGWSKNLFLYNTLLSMCADVRRVEEAVMLFKEMQQSDKCKPDSWSYTSMITLYTRGDQIEEANRMFNKMKEAGFRPSVMVYTSLIQCYGRAKRFDDFVKTFNLLLDEGIIPDDKFCSSLLWILTFCENEEIGKVLECIEKINPKLGLVVKMLQEEDIDIPVLQEELRTVFKQASNEVQRSFCSSLIDLCYNFNCQERARDLLYLGTQFGLYKNLHTKSPAEWCLDLRSLSFKAAVTAFDDWISSLLKALKAGEEMPQSLGIQTGRGSYTYRPDQALVDLFGYYLRELEFPFEKSTARDGWFFTTRDAVISWLQSRSS